MGKWWAVQARMYTDMIRIAGRVHSAMAHAMSLGPFQTMMVGWGRV